MTELVAY